MSRLSRQRMLESTSGDESELRDDGILFIQAWTEAFAKALDHRDEALEIFRREHPEVFAKAE